MSAPSSFRPIYTKSRKTKSKTPRFHGAFRGGFSAGYFNTVGSKQGWKSSDECLAAAEEEGMHCDGSKSCAVAVSVVRGTGTEETTHHGKLDHGHRGGPAFASRRRKRKQRVEDFMDDEDANDWGGPVSVKQDYHEYSNVHKKASVSLPWEEQEHIMAKNIQSADALRQMLSEDFKLPPIKESIGKQLLRVLGWREMHRRDSSSTCSRNKDANNTLMDGTSYIYLPMEDGDNHEENESEYYSCPLKRIKRIERKLSKHKKDIPKPKIDTYGLGYDAFHNAPEFKSHKEERHRKAYLRAQAASSSHGDYKQNVYRTSVLGDDDGGDGGEDSDGLGFVKRRFGHRNNSIAKRKRLQDKHSNDITSTATIDPDVLAYETTEDFIGQKSVGGFALYDDEDDVYDDNVSSHRGGARNILESEEYHNEIVDGSDSDGDGNVHQYPSRPTNQNIPVVSESNVASFAGALSSWATLTENQTNGVPVKSMSVAVTSDGKEPLIGFTLGGYGIGQQPAKRFPGPDIPGNFVATRHVFQVTNPPDMLQQLLSSHTARKSLDEHRDRQIHPKQIPAFNSASIRRDLKPLAGNSFSALSGSLKDRFRTTSELGNVKEEEKPHSSLADPTKVTVIRKQLMWKPSPLLCKRMNVAPPRLSYDGKQEVSETKVKNTADTFFHNVVLQNINVHVQSLTQDKNDASLSGENIDFDRPTLEIMKSIFEPDRDVDDMSISDDDDDDD